MTDTHLVLGGTGKTGTRLVRHLTAAGATARPAARTPGPAAPGVEPVRFDWDDPSTHDAALAGARGAYLVPPALRLDYADQLAALTRRAVGAGVERLVLLSARGPADPSVPDPLTGVIDAVRSAAGDVGVTVLRPSWFAQNFTESFFVPGIRAEGALVAPTGDGAHPFIDADDIAAVAAAALTQDGHAGRTYDLSGPVALTFAQAAAVLTPYAGREVRHVDVPVDDWRAGAVAGGLPEEYGHLLAALLTAIREGRDAHVSDGVQQALGRPATPLEDWAAREAGVLAG